MPSASRNCRTPVSNIAVPLRLSAIARATTSVHAGLGVRADAARDRIASARTGPHRLSRLDAESRRGAEHHSAERTQNITQVLERRHSFLLSECSDQWWGRGLM